MMQESERQKRLEPLVVAVERWATARRAGEDGWEVAREELRESWPGFLETLLVPAVLSGNFSLLGTDIPERSAPAVDRVLKTLDDNFFSRLERAGCIKLGPQHRSWLVDIVYGWVALQVRGRGKRLRRQKGAPRKWEQESLITLLSMVYEAGGGKRSLSWCSSKAAEALCRGETIASPHADFLRFVWEALPTELTARTSSETFVRRARTEHFFSRRFKDDAEHSEWWQQEKKKKSRKSRAKRPKKKKLIFMPYS